MNLMVLKSYPLVKNVIIIKKPIYISYFLFLVVILTAKGQEIVYDGYQIIAEVIAKDTIPDKFDFLLLQKKRADGKITKEDSINYLLRIKKKPLILIRNTKNKYAQEELVRQYLGTKEIAMYLGRNQLLQILKNIKPDQNHPKELKKTGITILEEKPRIKTHHYFSNPFEIQKNKFIIYHFKYVGRGVGLSEFIIYCRL